MGKEVSMTNPCRRFFFLSFCGQELNHLGFGNLTLKLLPNFANFEGHRGSIWGVQNLMVPFTIAQTYTQKAGELSVKSANTV